MATVSDRKYLDGNTTTFDRLVGSHSRKYCWLVRFILIAVISAFRSHVARCCMFPVFMQTNVTSPMTSSSTSRDQWLSLSGLQRPQQPIGSYPKPMFRDWRGRIVDQHTNAGEHVTIYDDVMTVMVVVGESMTSSYTRRCVEAVGDDRFIVAHADGKSKVLDDHVTSYTCIQFVRRAPDVVQLRVGPRIDRPDRDICSYDVIKLDPWLLVDWNSNVDQTDGGSVSGGTTPRRNTVTCALRGGFGVRMYDRTGHQGACDSRRGETRMESDCERLGDGTYFQFRHVSCVPVGLYMYTTQRTLCVGNWVTGPFGFTLLRHDRLRYHWLLRYPSAPEESFTAYLFTDLVADMSERIAETNNYIRMDTVRDTPRPVTSLCVDEHDVCATWRRPCASGPQMALACPRTCGVCNATRPAVCEFPSELIGSWYDGGSDTMAAAEFDRTTLTVKPEAGSRLSTMRCVRWNAPTADSLSQSASGRPSNRFSNVFEEMLVTETVDGCRPRYVCIRLLRKSPSVIYFRLSSPRQWPLSSLPSSPIDCRSFSYDYDVDGTSEAPDDNGFYKKPATGRGRHGFRLLLSREPRGAPVQCRLPGGQLNNYSVTFRCASDTVVDCVGCAVGVCGGGGGAADCQGSLAETESGTALRLTLSGCSQTNRTEYLFDCRQSSRLVPSKDLVIVVSSIYSASNNASSAGGGKYSTPSPNRTVYHCWAFPSGPPSAVGVFYLFDGSGCDDAMRVIDFTDGTKSDGAGLPISSSSSLFSTSAASMSSSSSSTSVSPSSLALATFASKPRRSPREEEEIASVSVASGSRSALHNSGLAAGVLSTTTTTTRIQMTSTTAATVADRTSTSVVVISVSLAFLMIIMVD